MCQKSNGKWLLLGITSNGDGCGRANRPGVYTLVSKYMEWIQNTTCKLLTFGTPLGLQICLPSHFVP